jgi:hypothetical protein
MTMKPSSYLLVIIIIVAAIFGGVSLTYTSFKMKLLPAIMSGLIFVLAVIELTRETLDNRRGTKENQPKAEGSSDVTLNEAVGSENADDVRGDMVGFAWLIGMIIAVYLVGFLISIPLFILIYLKIHGVNWLKSAIMAAAAVIFTYLVFVKVMQVELFPGIIMEFFM